LAIRQLKLRPLAVLVDACIVVNAYCLASLVLFSRWAPLKYYQELLIFLPIAVLIHCFVNLELGLYRTVWRYADLKQGIRLSQAALLAAPLLVMTGTLTVPSSYLHVLAMVLVGGVIAFIIMAGVRFYPRICYERSRKGSQCNRNVLIVGAGAAGEMIVSSFQKDYSLHRKVVCLIDDDPELWGLAIHGIPISGPTEKIPELVDKKEIDEIIISMPSTSLAEFQKIWKICSRTSAVTRTLRPLQSMHYGKADAGQLKEVEIEDLLGRQPVETDYTSIRDLIRGKNILITGAGGSIGTELALQISRHNPARIILADRDESALYGIHEKLTQDHFLNHSVCVMDVQLEAAVESVFSQYNPHLVFHTAAYKHVPLMELQPEEAVLNNVKGTWVVAKQAGIFGAECFINISTDKAVEPVNVMGATKHLGERLVKQFGAIYPETGYRSVRFGNVLGSRGSVIPIFREQIQRGGPVTITHPDMTRYFMLISEAVDLILQAAAFPDGDEIFVLEMGQPVRIVDVARQMISFMGQDELVDVIFTGLRPGEKINEKLLAGTENRDPTSHSMIYRVHSSSDEPYDLLTRIPYLFDIAKSRHREALIDLILELTESYIPFDMNNEVSAGIFPKPVTHEEHLAVNQFSSQQHAGSYQWFTPPAPS